MRAGELGFDLFISFGFRSSACLTRAAAMLEAMDAAEMEEGENA